LIQGEIDPSVARTLEQLRGFLTTARFDAEANIVPGEGDTVTLAISGPDAHWLVGHRGQTLDALQHLLLLMGNKTREHGPRIVVDADGYRERRIETLTRFARELAVQVGESGQEAETDALSAMERRIIHTALMDHPQVRTYSEGDEPRRYVVVSPRDPEE
jgi:spoIIIJ-associated protein